jgi:outer membrane protein assembly factor BamB
MSKVEGCLSCSRSHSLGPCVAFTCLLLLGSAIAAPSITLSKKIGPPTSKILVSGSGFAPNVGVDIYFDTKDEALVVTNNEGEFHNAAAYAPREALPGEHWVTVLRRHTENGDQEPFVVNTNWPQFNFDSSHRGVNSYENVLNQETVTQLKMDYEYATGSAIQSGPSFVNGVVYLTSGVSNYEGNVYAFDTRNRRLLWEVKTGSAISGSPTVSDEIVYVATIPGNVYALDALTGRQIWSVQTLDTLAFAITVADGVVYFGFNKLYALDARTGVQLWTSLIHAYQSPAVVDGVVFASGGNDFGDIYALNAQTGKVLWMFVSSPDALFFASPSVVDGVVYAGAGDGNIYALNAQNGALLWKTQIGFYYGAPDSCPAVVNGIVYIGSNNGNTYALNANTGAIIWTYPTGFIQSSPAIANGVVYVAELYGNVYVLNADNGSLLWEYTTNESIAGNPIVANGVLYVGSAGGLNGHLWAFGLDALATNAKFVQRPRTVTLSPDLTLQASDSAARPAR